MLCPLCNNNLRISGTSKKQFDIPDNPTKVKVIMYQNFTCINNKSMDNGGNPCPNVGKLVQTVEHPETIDRATTDTDLKAFVERVITDKFTADESMILATKMTERVVLK